MADFYRVRIEAVRGKCLTCQVTELYGDGRHLEASRTLALGFLWDTVDWFWWISQTPNGGDLEKREAAELAAATPLGRELPPEMFDEAKCREIVERFISCVGVVDRSRVVLGADEWSHYDPTAAIPQATYHIAVTDPRWIEHLQPGMKWESRVWDCEWYGACKPEWRTTDVMSLAKRIDAVQEFGALPILADALQEAGCDNERLFTHLRDTDATHVRGCWALDLVLGRDAEVVRLEVGEDDELSDAGGRDSQ